MNRAEVVLLLKDIISSCESFSSVESESIEEEKETAGFRLRIKWIPNKTEQDCLEDLAQKHNAEMQISKTHTVFRPK